MENNIVFTITFKMPDGKIIKGSEFWGEGHALPRIGEHFCIKGGKDGHTRLGNIFPWIELLSYLPQGKDKEYIENILNCDQYTSEQLNKIADIIEKNLDLHNYCKVNDVIYLNHIEMNGDSFLDETIIVLEWDKDWYDAHYKGLSSFA